MQALLRIEGQTLQLVDLPGLYDLRGHSDDEAVVRRFLEATPIGLVLVVLNASQLDAVLLHPLLGMPLVFTAMALIFQLVYAIGVPIQEGLGALLDAIGKQLIQPLLTPLPAFLQGFLLDGLWQGLGTVVAFLPGSPCSSWPWVVWRTAATSHGRPI